MAKKKKTEAKPKKANTFTADVITSHSCKIGGKPISIKAGESVQLSESEYAVLHEAGYVS